MYVRLRRLVPFALLFFACAASLHADETVEAYTADGMGVILHDDGRWEYTGEVVFYDVEQNDVSSVGEIDISDLLSCLVTRIIDGDTIEVNFDNAPVGLRSVEIVRFLGIAAPEIRSKKHGWEAAKARDFVAQRVAGKKVYLAFESRWCGDFGRVLAYVFCDDGVLLNAELLSRGLAKVYDKQPCYFHEHLKSLELAARMGSIGIWSSGVITDIIIQDICNDGRSEYVALWNTTGHSISLSGWYLQDEQSNRIDIPPGTLIAANEMLYVLSGLATTAPSDPFVYPTKSMIWNNGGDTASLYNEKGDLAAEYSY